MLSAALKLYYVISHFLEFIAQPGALKRLDEDWDLLAPHFLDYNYTLPKGKHVEVARRIRQHYFGSKKIDAKTTSALVQVASDRFFVVDSEKAARMQAKANQQPVWYYYYTYRGAESLSDAMSGTTNNYGMLFQLIVRRQSNPRRILVCQRKAYFSISFVIQLRTSRTAVIKIYYFNFVEIIFSHDS